MAEDNPLGDHPEMGSVLVLYDEELLEPQEGAKFGFNREEQVQRRVGVLNLQRFTDNLKALCSQMGGVFDIVRTNFEHYDLDAFELALDLTAKGEIRLVGSVGTEFKGGLKLVFHRKGARV